MPTAAKREATQAMIERSHDCLDILKRTNVWMTAWAVAQELQLPSGRQTRNALDRLVQQGDAEAKDSLSQPYGFGRHYHATQVSAVRVEW